MCNGSIRLHGRSSNYILLLTPLCNQAIFQEDKVTVGRATISTNPAKSTSVKAVNDNVESL